MTMEGENGKGHQHSMKKRTLIEYFLDSACRHPDRPALVVGNETLSYRELRQKAELIAHRINVSSSTSAKLVGILTHREAHGYQSILGALMSGRAYLPLHPQVPTARHARMLQLAGTTLLVAAQSCREQLFSLLSLVDSPLEVFLPGWDVGEEERERFQRHRFHSVDESRTVPPISLPAVGPDDIAYVLFTSGTTGEPKGVPITQANVCAYLENIFRLFSFEAEDRFSQNFDLTFDLSVHDLFVCWGVGACLYPVPDTVRMAPAAFIRSKALTIWFSVPFVAASMEKLRLLKEFSFPSLRMSFFCGEALPARYVTSWKRAAPSSQVINLYGPTECTIAVSYYRWPSLASAAKSINGTVAIGRPFEDQRFQVIDENGKVVDPLSPGELCLTGTQLSPGYLNPPGGENRAFGPIGSEDPAVWYRTGDVVQQDQDGCLYYLGRLDQQVKIRGYRVELNEVEEVLRHTCRTSQAAAIVCRGEEGIGEGIIGFVAAVENFQEVEAMDRCSRSLPPYMIPQRIFALDGLPLNDNGKIDRNELQKRAESFLNPRATRS